MIKDYSKNACPVIELQDLQRAIFRLPSRQKVNQDTKSDTFVVTFDEDEEKFVMFDWDERCNQWRLRNKIVFEVNEAGANRVCSICNKTTLHIINAEITRKKCKVCNTVTNV